MKAIVIAGFACVCISILGSAWYVSRTIERAIWSSVNTAASDLIDYDERKASQKNQPVEVAPPPFFNIQPRR